MTPEETAARRSSIRRAVYKVASLVLAMWLLYMATASSIWAWRQIVGG